MKLRLSTAFHPQTDGQTERMNQTLEQYLRCYCIDDQESWPEKLVYAEFAVNNSVHHATRMSPFEVLYGWNPDIHPAPTRDESLEGKVPAAAERAKSMRATHEALEERWRESQKSQKAGNDRRMKPQSFKVGDKVLLSTKNRRMPGLKRKLNAKFVGPFRVIDAVGSQAYRLALPEGYGVHDVFHVSLLEQWRQRSGEEPMEPMPLAEEDGEYDVESIRDSKTQKGRRYYLVQWKGWPEEYTRWEPAENCEHAQEEIAAYEKRAKTTRRGPGRPKKQK